MDIIEYLNQISSAPEIYMSDHGENSVDADGIPVIDGMFREGMSVMAAPNPRGVPGFPHRHRFIEIMYCLSGGAETCINGQNISLEQGDFCILDMHCVHTIDLCPADSLVLTLGVKPRFFDETFFGHFYSASPLTSFFSQAVYSGKQEQRFLVFRTGDDYDIRYTFTRIAQEYYLEQVCNREIVESMLMVLFAESIRLFSRMPDRCIQMETHGGLPMLENIITYVSANLSTVTRQSAAEHFGYSYSYFSKIIQSVTGGSFTDLRNRLRIQQADKLLCTTALPVEQVSEMAGFSNVSAFYKLFRKVHGMRPQEFRKTYQRS